MTADIADSDRDRREEPSIELMKPAALGLMWEKLAQGLGPEEQLTAALLEVDHLPQISKRYGPKMVRTVVVYCAGSIRSGLRSELVIGRWSGYRLVAVSLKRHPEEMVKHLRAVLAKFKATRFNPKGGRPFRTSFTAVVLAASPSTPLRLAIDRAGELLAATRKDGGGRVVTEAAVGVTARPTVLIAEDDEMVAALIRHRLGKDGISVVHFANGRKALDAAREKRFSLVILDIRMPGMDGFSVLKELRELKRYEEVPIIMLTSLGSEKDIVRAFKLGADDYVVKPHAPQELSARVRRLLNRDKKTG